MNYEETLQYLYQQLPMFQRVGPPAFKKDLTNIIALCGLLDQPQQKFKSVHIAGTNGKGSVSHLLAAALQAAGYKVGLYTSPHYKDFRERIKINGKLMNREAVVQFVAQYKNEFEKIEPSFFEISVAMAFDYFEKEKIDFAVVETGLGGRLDSTNILQPLLSVITNIGYDHTQFLGETLPLIATEKAGIIKPHTPVVIGETDYETAPIFMHKANEQESAILFADEFYRTELLEKSFAGMELNIYYMDDLKYPHLKTDLIAGYQEKNMVTSICALEVLKDLGIEISKDSIYAGIENVRTLTNFMGRWQILKRDPVVICDSGHNAEGLTVAIHELLKTEAATYRIVFGTVSDKDPGKMLSILPKEATYYFCKPDIPRGLDQNILKEKAEGFDLSGKAFPSVKDGYEAALRDANSNDVVLVGGSAFVVAEVLP